MNEDPETIWSTSFILPSPSLSQGDSESSFGFVGARVVGLNEMARRGERAVRGKERDGVARRKGWRRWFR